MKLELLSTSTTLLFLSNILQAEEIDNADLNITQIYTKYGYPVETHEVETPDGYLLGVFRVPHGRISNNLTTRYPVLLMHGLMGSAENFMYLGPNNSLSYILADRGYDVWLGNARGNMHSRKHKTLDPDKDHKFWEYSWHEIGVVDQPAVIEYILKQTGHSKVYYIGHSQGTTTYFVMTSAVPEMNQKIRLGISLAPGVFYAHQGNMLIRMVSQFAGILDRLARALNIYEILPFIPNHIIRGIARNLCDGSNFIKTICKFIAMILIGDDPEQLDESLIPYMLSTVPAGASVFQAIHYAQCIKTGKFRQYDFGEQNNLKRYKSKTPPDYNLKNSVAPASLIYGLNDQFSTLQDVTKLSKIIPNVADLYQISHKKFTHFDFVFAKDSVTLFINEVLDVMEKYKE